MIKLFMWVSVLVLFAPTGLVAAHFAYKRLSLWHKAALLELRERELTTKQKEIEFSDRLVF